MVKENVKKIMILKKNLFRSQEMFINSMMKGQKLK